MKYFKHKLNNLVAINKIVTIHYFEFPKTFRSKGESHDFWELVYADKNSIICTADNESLLLKEGEALFHKPNEYHILSADGKNAPVVIIISFECKSESMSFFKNKKMPLDLGTAKLIYSIVDIAKTTFYIPYSDPNLKKMRLLNSPTLGGEQLIKNYLEILLIEIMRNLTEFSGKNTTFLKESEFEDKLIKEVVEIINDRVFGTLHISDICDKVNYSKAYIFKEFKKHTGKTIFEYYNSLKIDKAKELLKNENFSIKEISEKLCYDTPNYFSKTFKKYTNETPSQYRKRFLNLM